MFIQYLSSLCMTQDYIDYDIYGKLKDIVYEKRRDIFKKHKNNESTNRVLNLNLLGSDFEYFSLFSLVLKNNLNSESSQILQKMLKNTYFQNVSELEVKERKYTSSEILKQLLEDDYGSYLYNLISYNNVSLKNDSFESMLVSYKKYLQSDENEGEQNENKKCTIKLEIAKKYNDYDKMMEDNMQTIYFDENYDNTSMLFWRSIIKKNKVTPSQFEIFLSSKLKK